MSAEHHHPVPGTLPELCDKILSLIASYPEACARGVRRMTADTEGLKRLAVAFGAIGYEYSRQLFPWITDLQWFMMENHASQAMQPGSASAIGQSVLAVFTDLLAESMDEGTEGPRDPFAFLNDLEAGRLAEAVNGESPSSLALIATHWSPSDMSRVLRVLPEPARIQTILQIARLQRLPDAEARKAAARFAENLRTKIPPTTNRKPVVRPAVAARVAVPPRATVMPPPPPVPRISGGDSAKAEETLLAALRAEAPELYGELAQGDYFKAIPRR